MNHDAETTINDGYGGLGLVVDITGANVSYAGGGNGADFNGSVSQVFDPTYNTIQLRGGGGYGSDNGTPQNGLDGTGGGGGGQGNDTANGGTGGNGVIIIRYRNLPTLSTTSSSLELSTSLSPSTSILSDDEFFSSESAKISVVSICQSLNIFLINRSKSDVRA
jgi:hypothetical protein